MTALGFLDFASVFIFALTGALAAEFYRMRLPEMGRALLMRQFQGGALESLATMLAETGIDSLF